jgi:hypothetical protein
MLQFRWRISTPQLLNQTVPRAALSVFPEAVPAATSPSSDISSAPSASPSTANGNGWGCSPARDGTKSRPILQNVEHLITCTRLGEFRTR